MSYLNQLHQILVIYEAHQFVCSDY